MIQTQPNSPLARAEAAAPLIAAHADQIDRDRQLPPELVANLKDAGLFRLLVPSRYGGEEMPWPDYLDVIRTIAMADASTAWCVNQGAVFATTSARCSEALASEIWGDPQTVVGNGPPQRAESTATDRGYRLSGRWMFSSGCRHANWIAAVGRADDGKTRLHMLPSDQVRFIDVWQVNGLRGTGSFGFEVEDLFVPEARTTILEDAPVLPGALYVVPQNLLFAAGFGCVALGVSRAAVDATLELARSKKPRFGRRPLAEDSVVQQKIGKAEATWSAAKALLHETVTDVWEAVRSTGAISVEQRIRLRMAGTHAIRQSADVVDIVYNLSGSDAIFASQAIQRRFQDAHAITQQVQGRESHYETVGQFHLGLEPTGPVF